MPDLEPITRLEEYLSKLAGDDVAVPEPITRVEKFLAYIAGEADSKPTPITRIEKFLDAIGQGGGGGGGGGTVIVPEQTVTTDTYDSDKGGYVGTIQNAEIIVDGETYTVTVDGVTEQMTARSMGGFVLLSTDDYAIFQFESGEVYVTQMLTGAEETHTIKATQDGGGSATLITKTINTNGTYDASDDDADGYSEVTVSVPNTYAAGDEGKVVSSGALVTQTAATYTANSVYDTTLIDEVTVNVSGGGGGYTLLASQDFEVNTTSTSDVDVGTMNLGSSAYTSDKILYVKIRDKAGARASHYIGTDAIMINPYPTRGGTSNLTAYAELVSYLNSSNNYQTTATTTGYGLKGTSLTEAGVLTIKARYNSTYGAIDGTYNVSVYLLDYAPNQGNPFNYSY